MARWQAELSQNQSRSVMVFTIFTVVFLPLSFFTGLFGMNIREWLSQDSYVQLHTVIAFAG
jgi:Mg2+ and Co2+ transporter CorA